MPGIDDGVIGQRRQLREAVVHLRRVATREVGAPATVQEQSVS